MARPESLTSVRGNGLWGGPGASSSHSRRDRRRGRLRVLPRRRRGPRPPLCGSGPRRGRRLPHAPAGGDLPSPAPQPPPSQSAASFHLRTAAPRAGRAGAAALARAPPTWSSQDVASRWRQAQMFSQATPPQGSGRLRGAVTGKAYSTVTTQWRGWGNRIFVLLRSRKNSVNPYSKQQAASARIYLLFFFSSIGLQTLFWFRDKLGVIVTNKVWFWWLLNQPLLLQRDPKK